jgi:hypothetical protein
MPPHPEYGINAQSEKWMIVGYQYSRHNLMIPPECRNIYSRSPLTRVTPAIA